jgi:peptide/nickel transport system substrate-binding protein
MFRWKATAAAILAAAALTLAGCSSSGENSTASASGGTLTLGSVVTPQTFDPADAQWANAAPYYQAVFDTILRLKSDGTVVPMLASKYTYNSDRTQLTLTIRDGVTFTDGSKLNAAAVKDNLVRFQKGTSPDAQMLAGVKSIAVNGKDVILTLNAPDPALVSNLARDAGLVASEKSLTAGNIATNPVGSGPYVLDTRNTVSGSSYVYTKNRNYWDKSLQHYDKLVINFYGDPTAALNAIKGGAVNAVTVVNNNGLDQIKAAGWTINTSELGFMGVMLYDRGGTMNPALGNLKVRQAVNMAFDRKALLKAVVNGYGTVTEQVFSPSSPGYDKSLDTTYKYDPTGAKKLLAQAGYPNGFTLDMPTTAVLGTSTFNLISQQLADIGVTVKYTDAGNNYIPVQLAPKYSAAYMALGAGSDWGLILMMLAPTAAWNPFHYSDPTASALIKKVQYGDASAVKNLNTYIVKQAWFAPFFRAQGVFASDAHTSVTVSTTDAYPAIYDFVPKS